MSPAHEQPRITTNPLLEPWPGPYGGVPPWDRVEAADFPSAFEAALADERGAVAAIVREAGPPDFDNTLAALQRAGRLKDRVLRTFNVMRFNMSTPEYQELDREWQPRFAAADDAIVFYPGLFERIDVVYRTRESSGLRPDQIRLATRVWEHFVRSGARLPPDDRERLSALNQELAVLYADFRAKVMADEATWTRLGDADDLAGLPESFVAATAEAARERGLSNQWVVLNTRSSVEPFLTFSARRDLRERVWRQFKSRGDNRDANDTTATITRIVQARAERAALLGFPSHAHWQMADSMAGDPARAMALLRRVWHAAVARVRTDVDSLTSHAERDGIRGGIQPWDYLYYAERVRRASSSLDLSALRPHFELNNMLAAAMWSAEVRFDITFTEVTDRVPRFHPDVRVWEVVDRPDGAHRGLFYFDTFARTGKRSGAWASNYRSQHRLDGPVTAIASNNNNFLKAGPGEPVFVSLDDVRTLFHEFGHSLHSLLQDITYPGLASTPRDFVELPSQINERWFFTREVLDRFARHYVTGAPLAESIVYELLGADAFNQGYKTVEAVSAAMLDLELHTSVDGVFEPASFEREALARIGMPCEIALRHRLPHFDHLFGSDGYSGLYYCYLWADVMSADGWDAFLEGEGPWDREVAKRLRTHILSDGNTIDRAEAYR
ncbi:MAG: M3 family metallopeptidase, partial [Vicinamibacterales bacterium]